MSDFHSSLDRALEPDPHNDWGIEGDALADLMAARGEPLADQQIPAEGTE